MRKIKAYRYIGRNGILTTRILLDGINHIDILELYADDGKVLVKEGRRVHSVVIEADDLDSWNEIPEEDETN